MSNEHDIRLINSRKISNADSIKHDNHFEDRVEREIRREKLKLKKREMNINFTGRHTRDET